MANSTNNAEDEAMPLGDVSITKTYGDDNKDAAESNVIDQSVVHVYRRRWYILFSFGSLIFMQNTIWNTWGPITNPAERVFQWEDYNIALLANMGPVAYMFLFLPVAYMMDVKGLRFTCLYGGIVILIGAALRLITQTTPAATWLILAGHFFNGMGGPLSLAMPAVLSSTWFPPQQRTTATAIGYQMGFSGHAAAFLIGPSIVRDTAHDRALSEFHCVSLSDEECPIKNNSTLYADIPHEAEGIRILMIIEFAMVVAICILLVVYFPARPLKPPSLSAATSRLNFMNGIKQLMKQKNFLMITVCYGITSGVNNGWCSVLILSLDPLGISQVEASWIGLAMELSSSLAAIFAAMAIDIIGGCMRVSLLILLVLASMAFIWFALITYSVIDFTMESVYASTIIGSIMLQSTVSLFMELAVEATYPIAEGITVGVLTFANNFITLLFLIVPIVVTDTRWMSIALIAVSLISIPIMCLVQIRLGRTTVDRAQSVIDNVQKDRPLQELETKSNVTEEEAAVQNESSNKPNNEKKKLS